MFRDRRKLFIVLMILIVVVIGSQQLIKYFNSFEKITITAKNVSEIDIYNLSQVHEGSGNVEPTKKLGGTGGAVRIKKNTPYSLSYTGAEGYASDTIPLNGTSGGKVDINPYFSEEKLATLLGEETAQLQSVFADKYPGGSLYDMQQGKLYYWGDWYGTTLKYIGTDQLNSDTLRLVMHKENNVWTLKTDPPNIYLSKLAYKDVPEEILSVVNQLDTN